MARIYVTYSDFKSIVSSLSGANVFDVTYDDKTFVASATSGSLEVIYVGIAEPASYPLDFPLSKTVLQIEIS